ncbi:unnamed protein product [Lepidochelys kempii]
MAAGDLAESFQDKVTCSICLEYFTDPVTIECGQNFCQACLSQCWGELEPNFSCPQCRESTLQRDLRPHGQLGNLAELVKCLRLQAGPEPEGQRVGDRHQEALKLSCEEDQTPLCLVCDRSWAHRTRTVVPMEEAAQEHREQIPTRLQHLWEETEELLGLKSDWDKERERLLRQTEVERPLVVSKCEGLHQFLAEQERLLLARLGELGEEIGRRREDNATHLGEEISRLSALITELEGKRQQPVLELLQGMRRPCLRIRCLSPELEKRIRDFPQENNLQEAVTGFLECFRRRARAEIVEKQHHLPHNLSHAERNAIHSLRNNSDIIIKKADKGGAVVIMNRSEYEQEAARQLSNTSFYKPLPYDPTESYQKQLQHLLKKLPEKAQDQIHTDTPLEPRPGIFYLLPKIHKPGNPGRPIISGIGTLTAGLSGYVDSLLRPYATSTPSNLRDTTDFLRKLQSIGDLPENTVLATMDVEALYTNIPHKDGLQAVRNSIPDNVTANLVAELCDFVLNHNYFTFGDNVYLQISGTAMGTRMAPQYANIFMADLEQRFLSSRPLKPLLYLRYIDDIFIIWTHGKEALEEFHHDFNNFHPTINLSLVQSTQEIHFLDTTVLINNGHINTTLYRKPTDRYSYLHASSFHPDHTTRSIVYSQALRYNRICSNPSDRDKHLQDLCQVFLQLQYPPAEVKKQIDRARRVPRSYLLQDRPNKENNRTPLAVTFSPQLKPLQRIIKDLQPILKADPTLSQILGDRPVLAYRQPPNLKQILTNNHIPHNRTTNPGTYPCNKARCQLCPHIYSGDTITGPNHISHTIRGSFTCTSANVIYAIMCQQCPSAMYIGQTGQSLRKRINGHKSDVKNYNIHKPVGEHFNLSGHAITDMKVAILKQENFKSRLQRETAELEFICKLDTINLGLNRDWEWLSHYAR